MIALLAPVLATGCEVLDERVGPRIERRPPILSVGDVEVESWNRAVRLAPAVLREQRASAARIVELDLDTIAGRDGVNVERSAAGISASSARGGITLFAEVEINLRVYRELIVRATVDGAGRCAVGFRGPPPFRSRFPQFTQASRVVDGATREFRFTLPDAASFESSFVDGIDVWFLGTQSVQVSQLAFEALPPRAPERHELHGIVRDVLAGTQPPWQLSIPRRAVFQSHVTYEAPGEGMPPVRFRVSATTPDGVTVALITRELEPTDRAEWHAMDVPLDALAGQRVTLHLDVEASSLRASTAGIWGEPLVVTRVGAAESTPVVLISVDTLRADHLGLYGYARATSPNLDAWSREAARFDQAIVYEPWTLTSHMTMLTGLHHERHGVNHSQDLPESRTTLAERLRDAGYVTAAFVGHQYWLDPSRGFKQGFDMYGIPTPRREFEGVDVTVDKAVDWLRGVPTNQFFLFVHTYEVHSKFRELGYVQPYVPSDEAFIHFGNEVREASYPAGETERVATDFLSSADAGEVEVTARQRDHMIAMYDDTIRMVDSNLVRLFDALKARGVYDKALIIVTADHGEAFGEHGHYLHSTIHDSCVRVPLLVKFPHGRFAGESNARLVTNADLFPTVLDVVGLPAEPDLDGIPLTAALTGTGPFHREAVLTFRPREDGVRTPEWKLIHDFLADSWSLYNVVADPLERDNRAKDAPPVLDPLRGTLAEAIEQRPGWHIDLYGGTRVQSAELEITATQGFSRCLLRRGESLGPSIDTLELTADRRQANADFVLERGDIDGLYIAARGTPIEFRVEDADGPLRLLMGERPAEAGAGISMTLDPRDRSLHTVPPMAKSDLPTLRVWYVPETAPEDARELTPEDLETIESLGYFAP